MYIDLSFYPSFYPNNVSFCVSFSFLSQSIKICKTYTFLSIDLCNYISLYLPIYQQNCSIQNEHIYDAIIL